MSAVPVVLDLAADYADIADGFRRLAGVEARIDATIKLMGHLQMLEQQRDSLASDLKKMIEEANKRSSADLGLSSDAAEAVVVGP